MKEILKYILFIISRILNSLKKRTITVEYPFVIKPIPHLARTRLKNIFSECIGCKKCVQCCPTKAIEIFGVEYSATSKRPITSKGVEFQSSVESFMIDYSKCVLCGICVLECQTQSLAFDRKIFQPQIRVNELVVDLVHLPRTMRRGFEK